MRVFGFSLAMVIISNNTSTATTGARFCPAPVVFDSCVMSMFSTHVTNDVNNFKINTTAAKEEEEEESQPSIKVQLAPEKCSPSPPSKSFVMMIDQPAAGVRTLNNLPSKAPGYYIAYRNIRQPLCVSNSPCSRAFLALRRNIQYLCWMSYYCAFIFYILFRPTKSRFHPPASRRVH